MLNPEEACKGQSGKFRAWYIERFQVFTREQAQSKSVELKEAA